jgi:hypothetical protein
VLQAEAHCPSAAIHAAPQETLPMFKTGFDQFICGGDSITCEVDGFRAVARIEYDHDTSPRDYDQPGWCFDTTSRKYGKQNRKIIAAWEADEWFYCGIVVTVFREGVKLGEAHLWGIEANFPFGKQKTRHAYHLTVANELLDEALDGARETIRKLAASIAA